MLSDLLDRECATLDDVHQLQSLMNKCQVLEEQCRNWSKTLPEYFKFTTVTWISDSPANPAEAEALPGPLHGYRDPWVGGIWNMVRASRVILTNLILRCSALIHQRTDVRALPEYSTLAQSCTDVINEIVAGVPYHLGWFKNRTALLPAMPNFACGSNGAASSLAAFLALFPLMIMQDHDFASDEQRLFAQGRLYFLSHNLGLRSIVFLNKVTFSLSTV